MGIGVVAERPRATESARASAAVGAVPAHAWRRLDAVLLTAALALSLLFSARVMAPALAADVVQDDARQHVFWMARFRDPSLLPNDLIADYYQALAPPAYSGLYWLLSRMVDPLAASKLLPPLLGLAGAGLTYLLARRMQPAPAGAFLASALASWFFWQQADLASATPRAFLWPLLAAQLWALAAGRIALAAALVVAGSLFYPLAGALGLTMLGLRLVRLHGWRPTLVRARATWAAFLIATALVGALQVDASAASARFGPTISAEEARRMPEFGSQGRQEFFGVGPQRFWLTSGRSGLETALTDARSGVPLLFELAALAALLPLLWPLRRWLGAWVDRQAMLLPQLLLASFGLFFLAHLVLFRLYLPNRYVRSSVPLALAVLAGLALGILLEGLGRRLCAGRRDLAAGGLALGLGLGLALYPSRTDGYFVGTERQAPILEYLRGQPKDILVASVPTDTDALATLVGRSVLTSREHMLPYHLGYYGEMKRRTFDLIKAYYAESPTDLAEFADRYGVGIFLVDRAAFDRVAVLRRYAKTEPYTSEMERALRRRGRFALLDLANRCAAADNGLLAAVPVSCLAEPTR